MRESAGQRSAPEARRGSSRFLLLGRTPDLRLARGGRLQQGGDGDAEQVGEFHKRPQGEVLAAALDALQVLEAHLGLTGKLLLRHAAFRAKLADAAAYVEENAVRVSKSHAAAGCSGYLLTKTNLQGSISP